MTTATRLASAFSWLVGNSPGSGMSLQYIISGLAYAAITLMGWFIPNIRNVETLLPDHDQLTKADEAQENSEER
jgi:hypothetical protein